MISPESVPSLTAPAVQDDRKPRLLWFRSIRAGVPEFIRDHFSEQVRTMSRFFELSVVDANGDYDRLCDQYEPDLCVFESGVDVGDRHLVRTESHPEVLKLGFLNADAYDASRAAFIADMERWGVQTYFTHSMSMADYTPEIADRLFVWPNRIEPEVYEGLSRSKSVDVLLTGSRGPQYPWRNAVSRVLAEKFVTTSLPHFGWGNRRGSERMAWGRAYASFLSSATFVPTCGSMSRDLLRKHLEIPAAGACLVTERTAVVEAAGFRDMVNCVFAERGEVVDRLEALLAEPELLAEITAAGSALVLAHHTANKRDQVLQWYRLARLHGAEFSFDQSWPEGAMSVRADGQIRRAAPIATSGLDREEIREGWEALRRGDVEGAKRAFARAMNFFFIPEAAVGLVFACLRAGDVGSAQQWLSRLLVTGLSHYRSSLPDPVFWACQIRIYLCSGELSLALAAARQFEELAHPELDRIRFLVLRAASEDPRALSRMRPAPSISPIPPTSPNEWESELSAMITACAPGRLGPALRIDGLLPQPVAQQRARAALRKLLGRHTRGHVTPAVPRLVRACLSPLKRRLTTDELSRYLADFICREPVWSAVFVGPARSRVGFAVQEGLRQNPNVHSIETVESRSAGADLALNVGSLPHDVEFEAGRHGFLAFVSGAGWPLLTDYSLLQGATTLILEGTATEVGARAVDAMLESGAFNIVLHEPYKGGGHIVLTRSTCSGQGQVSGRARQPSRGEW